MMQQHGRGRALARWMAIALGVACMCGAHAQTGAQPEFVRPSVANPAVQQFDEDSVVLRPQSGVGTAPLAIFLPGTGGNPRHAMLIERTMASQGYPTIGLEYDDSPAVSQVCPNNPNPACSFHFREMRSFGRGEGPVSNPVEEGIASRLVDLLRYLDAQHPGEGWSHYLNAAGRPQWSRILVSGLSQGAGMAAFIAKVYPVYRVVLFSSPWDTVGRDHQPAPWLFRPSATPMDRWWAERHARENTTEWLATAYRALQIPPSHNLVFNADLPAGDVVKGSNPYHPSTIMNPVYEPQWKTMFGTP